MLMPLSMPWKKLKEAWKVAFFLSKKKKEVLVVFTEKNIHQV